MYIWTVGLFGSYAACHAAPHVVWVVLAVQHAVVYFSLPSQHAVKWPVSRLVVGGTDLILA
jgi:hypothetical protein